MTYPEIVCQHLQDIIQYEIEDTTPRQDGKISSAETDCLSSRCRKRALVF